MFVVCCNVLFVAVSFVVCRRVLFVDCCLLLVVICSLFNVG